MINRYYGWYRNMGYPNLIPYGLSYDLEQWQTVEKKPMMISEYGASTIAGFHEVGRLTIITISSAYWWI